MIIYDIYIGLDLNKTTSTCKKILFSTNKVHYKMVVKNENDSKFYADDKSVTGHRARVTDPAHAFFNKLSLSK